MGMEAAIAVFIGVWIALSAMIAYGHMKKEYRDSDADGSAGLSHRW